MSTVESIHFFVALNLMVIGLSHFVQPKIWGEFFDFLHQKGNVGNIFNALLALAMGTFILSFHFIWKWPMILVTIYGLIQFIKGLLYLTIPSIGLKSIQNVNAQKFRWVGLVMLMLGTLLFTSIIRYL